MMLLFGLVGVLDMPPYIPTVLKPLLFEFETLCAKPKKAESLPLQGIQHQIDLVPGAPLPNLPHYRMALAEYVKLHMQITDLLFKGFVCGSNSPCTVLLFLRIRRMALGVCMLTDVPSTRSLLSIDFQSPY